MKEGAMLKGLVSLEIANVAIDAFYSLDSRSHDIEEQMKAALEAAMPLIICKLAEYRAADVLRAALDAEIQRLRDEIANSGDC